MATRGRPGKAIVVEVERKRWLRGEGGDESYLLRRSDRKMCCLGFALRRLGVAPSHIEGEASPASVHRMYKVDAKRVERFVNDNTLLPIVGNNDVCKQLIMYNDHISINDERREEEIIKLGHQIDLKFVFRGRRKA